MEISCVTIEDTYYLEKRGNSNSYFKNETDDDQHLFDIYDERNNTTNQKPHNLCNEVEETTNVTRTLSEELLRDHPHVMTTS